MDSKLYWESKIIEWEDSMEGGRVSLVERLAARFRKPLEARGRICRSILAGIVRGKRVVELGCGSGYFAFEMAHGSDIQQYTGFDISENAVRRANELAERKGFSGSFTFSQGDVVDLAMPDVDVVIGLGLLDYLTLPEIGSLFARIKGRYFLFTFAERQPTLLRFIHLLYMRSQRCPKHFYYSKDQIKAQIGPDLEKIRFVNDPEMSFGCVFHNIPDANTR